MVPKNLSIFDKNTYFASYIHDICNSCNYVYTNRWKPNSNWFGLLKVNVFFYDWYHLTFIFQVPYKKFDKNNTSNIYHIYTCYDIFIAGGEHKCFYICYNPFFCRERTHNLFSAGGAFVHTVSSSKRGRMLELTFDDTFVKSYHMELYHKPIQEFYMIKTSQRELIMMCIVMVDSMLAALKHTHTHIIIY